MSMFCFQCEQTAMGKGCTVQGVCGKKQDTAGLQDKLIGSLVSLSLLIKDNEDLQTKEEITRLILAGLFTTVTNVSFDNAAIEKQIEKTLKAAAAYNNGKEVGVFDMQSIFQNKDEDERSLKSLILFGIKGISAYAYHAAILGYHSKDVNKYFVKALCALGDESSKEVLTGLVLEAGKENLACMELLDKANTETYGVPTPVEVSMKVEQGPFIVVTGHDLKDLKMLLEQTKDKGVAVYTHGEMLPAHGYPKLREYPNFKGHFGTAWQNQKKEFDNIPGAVLFTTNCLMPPLDNYQGHIFTTEVVGYPGVTHITGEQKDFTPVINKAIELGGYKEDFQGQGINGGKTVMTGFNWRTVLESAPVIIDAVKSGAIKKFILVGGCDGAKPGRNYYTEFVKNSPNDSVILTLACGKYRFNDLDLGKIGPLPRIIDMGQCNDAYGAVQVALALSKAFDTDVNSLPLRLVLSWYEQKAVAVLLTLLYLGIKNMHLGPTPPAFVSAGVFDMLNKNYGLKLITTAEDDLKEIMS